MDERDKRDISEMIERERASAFWREIGLVMQTVICKHLGFYRLDDMQERIPDAGIVPAPEVKRKSWEGKPQAAKRLPTLGDLLPMLPDEHRDRLLSLNALWLAGILGDLDYPKVRFGHRRITAMEPGGDREDDAWSVVSVEGERIELDPPPLPDAVALERGAAAGKAATSGKGTAKVRTKGKPAKGAKKAAKPTARQTATARTARHKGKPAAKPARAATAPKPAAKKRAPAKPRRSPETLRRDIVAQVNGNPAGLTKAELRKRVDTSGATLDRTLQDLFHAGEIQIADIGAGAKKWRYVLGDGVSRPADHDLDTAVQDVLDL